MTEYEWAETLYWLWQLAWLLLIISIIDGVLVFISRRKK